VSTERRDVTGRLMAIFGEEAEERLRTISADLRRLGEPAEPTAIEDVVEALRCEAHSLKGAARAVGVERVETVADGLERVFARMLRGDLTPQPAVCEVARHAVDAARALVHEATAGEPAGFDAVAIAALLDEPMRGGVQTPPGPRPEPPAEPTRPGPTRDFLAAKLGTLRRAVSELTTAHAAVGQRLGDLEHLVEEVGDLLNQASATSDAGDRGPTVVLVVENSATTRTLQRHLLEAAGYKVREAADGDEAWKLLQHGDIHVVASDIRMPGIDGLELTTRIRADPALRDMPVILITATDAPGQRERSTSAGADAYFVKAPAEYEQLRETIERLTRPSNARARD
jgi:CheY-like chemotaxis protein/HPt (histidine-containing phosphotransfer) domain-containing protein